MIFRINIRQRYDLLSEVFTDRKESVVSRSGLIAEDVKLFLYADYATLMNYFVWQQDSLEQFFSCYFCQLNSWLVPILDLKEAHGRADVRALCEFLKPTVIFYPHKEFSWNEKKQRISCISIDSFLR